MRSRRSRSAYSYSPHAVAAHYLALHRCCGNLRDCPRPGHSPCLRRVFHSRPSARVCDRRSDAARNRMGRHREWWVGLLLGVPLAIVARVGTRPKRSAASLARPILYLLAVMAACAAAAGLVGWQLARAGTVVLGEPLASRLPVDRHVPFIAHAWAHGASYFVGFVGGLVVMTTIWRSRARAEIGTLRQSAASSSRHTST
jgi:hypothetical protein